MRKRTLKGLHSEAWKRFSEFIRQREADDEGYTHCVTCGKRDHWTAMQAGHFLRGKTRRTYLDERNVHVQCVRDNHYLSGNLIEYTLYMQDRYGPQIIDKLKALNKQIWKPKREELEALIAKYKS